MVLDGLQGVVCHMDDILERPIGPQHQTPHCSAQASGEVKLLSTDRVEPDPDKYTSHQRDDTARSSQFPWNGREG